MQATPGDPSNVDIQVTNLEFRTTGSGAGPVIAPGGLQLGVNGYRCGIDVFGYDRTASWVGAPFANTMHFVTVPPGCGGSGGEGTCAAGPDGWCWSIYSQQSTTAAWVAPPSATSAHAILTAEPASINLGNAAVGFTFAADNPLIDLNSFDRIVFTATASTGFSFNVASSSTAGCDLNFAGSGTEQTYTLNFSECTRWSSDSTKPGFSLASV